MYRGTSSTSDFTTASHSRSTSLAFINGGAQNENKEKGNDLLLLSQGLQPSTLISCNAFALILRGILCKVHCT
jgi:hypothetical protein